MTPVWLAKLKQLAALLVKIDVFPCQKQIRFRQLSLTRTHTIPASSAPLLSENCHE
ncbi:hypothetical protein GJA_45 [Janthinobacterium agaricidamnosum NBRC 102515 = DSM 9628]|uniref:Uncharacterized protein n=1 Tax=Janthinobacterium agaricidamnosum NBRC 102515 = DSM 9628 TaxID=1349767 RepID=W0V055_9BURK|nr:hypothetical protein GJA_45 [Janthinobacterium agaricidamnosum NBRC 102515 = DSM 9628]